MSAIRSSNRVQKKSMSSGEYGLPSCVCGSGFRKTFRHMLPRIGWGRFSRPWLAGWLRNFSFSRMLVMGLRRETESRRNLLA